GMGWRVVRDTGDTAPVSPTEIACRDIMKRASLPETAGATFCENFFFLKAGFDRMSVISPAAFSQAVNGLGKSYVGYLNIGGATSFNAAKHDGPTVVSALAYDNRCTSSGVTCFKYVGAPHPMPE
ncbi:MAG: hypothetical protein LC792_23845, partial [Actinobacteria bacterium]|nr:hypothetical protein [Actinomycetota bacterium]